MRAWLEATSAEGRGASVVTSGVHAMKPRTVDAERLVIALSTVGWWDAAVASG